MAWTTPRSWQVGDVVTAAWMNTYVSDDLNALAAGPYCDLYATAPGSTSSSVNVFTAIPFDTEVADTDTMHDTSTNTSRITATTGGLYLVSGGAGIVQQAAAVMRFAIAFYINGAVIPSTYQATYVPALSGTGIHFGLTMSRYLRLTAGQYVELQVASSTASVALNTGSSARPFFQARWVGP